MKTARKISYIYGLFEGEICLYVGQAVHPARRFAAHRTTSGKFYKIPCEIRILETCKIKDVNSSERAMIEKYQSIGEADFNDRQGPGAKFCVSNELHAPQPFVVSRHASKSSAMCLFRSMLASFRSLYPLPNFVHYIFPFAIRRLKEDHLGDCIFTESAS